MEIILMILFGTLALGFIILSYYLSFKNKLKDKILNLINEVEKMELTGVEKMTEVIEEIKPLIPTVLKPFFNNKNLEYMIQFIFDYMKQYSSNKK